MQQGRRSSYSLLSQSSDDPPLPKFDSPPSDMNRGRTAFEWSISGDCAGDDAGGPRIGMQCGSSYGESSVSGDFHLPATLTSDPDAPLGTKEVGSSSMRSWAQQAEETYQLQLALALRLCSEAACADDPYFLDSGDQNPPMDRSFAESLSHRFWVNGCLSYYDRVPDGFYLIQGMDPFVWTLCTDVQEGTRIPSIESLKIVHPIESSIEVSLIDRPGDPELRQLQSIAFDLSCSCTNTKDMVDQLAKLVCTRMGGSASNGENDLLVRWKECNDILKASSGSIVQSMGGLSIGLCRHRALLFKILADTINLPCRVAKGCKYCKLDTSSSCLVRFTLEREYSVDLIGNPGSLCEPDSLLNGPSSISISSPLHPPKFKSVQNFQNFRSLAKQYFMDCQSLNLMFNDASEDGIVGQEDASNTSPPSKCLHDKPVDEISQLQKVPNPAKNIVTLSEQIVQEATQVKLTPHDWRRDPSPILAYTKANKENLRLMEEYQQGRNMTHKDELADDLIIPWNDLVLKEKIGSGSFGTVHRADWNGSDVAVKILMEQDFHPERFKEFLREVSIMKSLRHPNIVLFMGAVTQPPNLSIVTEYLSRGSLYRLLHRYGAREILDERRRLNMAFDVAKGMNYLHMRSPPIVHRDLKSPNLLVDKKYTVKVCDFGLSRFKANTYLSSKSLAGTPEWMAPEVLRDEPSNEKSDIYSFGVILWELVTLQQPWCNLNPAQVVAAVGFKARRLEIPSDVNPQVAAIIESCWSNEPRRRPSFFNIMESLKKILIKPPSSQPNRTEHLS